MFGTTYHPILSTLAHFDHLKGQLSLLISHNLSHVLTINLIYVFTVCILVLCFLCVCVCVCARAAVSAGLSLAVTACYGRPME